ncbi:MAG: transcription-repair coupling factor [Spirochaetales bacterium]|nr:transcription-repair coupling factor [Spirochaetales bacterium]
MITLFINEISSKLNGYSPYKSLLKAIKSEIFPIKTSGIKDGLLSVIIENITAENSGTTIIITPSEQEAENVYQDLLALYEREVFLFPAWNVTPYKGNVPHTSHFANRSKVLSSLLNGGNLIIVCPLRAFITHLPDPDYLKALNIFLNTGDAVKITELCEMLSLFGYLRVPKVSVKGEFAVRGEVIDIFLPCDEEATRVLIGFDEIEGIKKFDPVTQFSTRNIDNISVFPLKELIFSEDTAAKLKIRLEKSGWPSGKIDAIMEKAALKPEFGGMELLFPLCFEQKFTLLDYLKEKDLVFILDTERMESHFNSILKEYRETYRQAALKENYLPKVEDVITDYPETVKGFERKILHHALKSEFDTDASLHFNADPPRSFFGNFNYLKEELLNLINVGYSVFIFAVYESQAERLKFILKDFNVNIVPASIFSGFAIPELKIIVISESEIFGRKRRIPSSIKTARTKSIESFIDLNQGDYIVHLNYGIGIFLGIERIKTSLTERDYICLEYAESEKIYIPIEQVNLIQRYIGQEGRKPKLDKIGGRGWDARKAKVKKSVEELAQHLIKIYSARKKSMGFAFAKDTDWQNEFEAGFPYQETEDQLTCIDEVKNDMENPIPMDRLICGDVGYGKTEIAMRAAFKAVMDGKQVAFLAPTTILVEQHYKNFLDRFSRFPVKVEMISRFRSRKEQTEIVKNLSGGDIDIIIGTHRLVQKDIRFKNLGLIITDEEQRFGVKHKERLKELKTNVDCLTLTATPIPRTLNMSLMKIRDMSILNTPPQNRMPIETYIQEYEDEIVASAIRKEIARGGQVFYLHNRVQTIPRVYQFLVKLVPEASIDIAHGQMDGSELEDVMYRFVNQEFDVLLSTTIIENGIDIPNVNTIIIDRADMYGIAQLYQLRGRVGRSDIPAFAYLFYPRDKSVNEIAMKRLSIISDYTELGSGFKIALKDMEIRGAGNILGREQSGDIFAVGFDMYIKLLDEAIADLNDEKLEHHEVYLELEYSGYIPDSYVDDTMEKMEVYKKMAAISTQQELDAVYSEIMDRFGPLPDEVSSILSIAEIRIICNKLFISTLKEKKGVVTCEFARLHIISVDKVLRLIKESGGSVFLDSKRPQCLFLRVQNIGLKEKSEFIRDKLSRLV